MAYDFWGSNFGKGDPSKNSSYSTGKSGSTQTKTSTPAKTTKSALSSALSKSGGSSGKSSSPAYSEHVSWFGSPEKYASAIQSAKSSGKALSDPNAAAAFERDNPQLFGGIVPGGGGGTPASTPSYNSGAASGGGVTAGGVGNNASALIAALKNVGSQFGSASPTGQTALNTQANEARNAFVQAGGNIQDVPTNLWGSSPGQGFQTGAESYMGAPSYGAANTVGGMPLANAGLMQGPAPAISGIGKGNLQDINRLYGQNTGQWWDTAETAAEAEDWINMVGPDAWKAMGSPNVSPEAFGDTFLWSMTGGKGAPPVPDEALNRISTGLNTGTLSPAAEALKKALESYMPVEVPIEQPDLMQQVQPLFNQYQSAIENMDSETSVILQNSLNQTMDMINSTEAALMAKFEEMGQGIDPATQAALASLKDTVNQQRDYLKEEMSSRGLLQSGIYLNDINEKINKNELTQTQQLLGQRLSDIQNQINNAILSFGNTRIQTTSQYGLAAQQAAEATAQRKQEATTSLTSALMKALELSNQQKSDAAKTAWEKEKFYAPWEKGPTPAEMMPYQYPSANTTYTHDNPSADSLLKQSQWETEWPWKQKQYQYDLGKPYYKPGSSSVTKTSDADIKRANLADAQNSIWNKLNEHKSIQEVEAAIVAEAGDYTLQGLNVQDLVDYAWYAATGGKKPTSQSSGTTSLTPEQIKAIVDSMLKK